MKTVLVLTANCLCIGRDNLSEEEQNTAIRSTFIGFGEAAQAFADGWSSTGITGFKSYDIKTDTGGDLKNSKQRDFDEHCVIGCQSVEAAVEGASTIFSLVTADQAKRAGQMVSEYINKDAFYFDCNSCSPQTKKTNSNVINSRGAKYIDVAIMAPVYPLLHRTPTLISGAYADEAAKVLQDFGMNVSIVGDEIGQASAIKLSRSIVIKGMEALLGEFVLDSLEKSNPNYPWCEQTAYA